MTTGPAAADLLVTRDGAQIETQGPWTVKGKLVVFTTSAGTLTSVRLESVDLNASAEATAAQNAPPAPPPPPEPPRKPVLVLTDADVGHLNPATLRLADPAATGANSTPSSATSAKPGDRLQVVGWQEVSRSAQSDGVALTGTLANTSAEVVSNINLRVTLFDGDGETLADANARLTADTLPGGGKARFRVSFPGTLSYSEARFESSGIAEAAASIE